MLFNPLRYENMSKEPEANDENISKSVDIECFFVNSEKLNRIFSVEEADLTLFNLMAHNW